MSSDAQHIKKDLRDIRLSEFKETYKEVTSEMLQSEGWTPEETEAMRLLAEGDTPLSIRKKMTLGDDSAKKIADLYFLILLNTIIRSKMHVPFKLPKDEMSSWNKDYSRNQFVSDLRDHREQLSRSVVGKEIIRAASEYPTLYNSTVAQTSSRANQKSEYSEKYTGVEKAADSLAFLCSVTEGLTFDPISSQPPMGSSLAMTRKGSDAAEAAYAIGVFATCVFELGGLAATLGR